MDNRGQRAVILLMVALIAACDYRAPFVFAISVLYIIPILLTVVQRSVRCTLLVTTICVVLDSLVYSFGHRHHTQANGVNQLIGLAAESVVGLLTSLYVRVLNSDEFSKRRSQVLLRLGEQIRRATRIDDVFDSAVASIGPLLSADRVYILPVADEIGVTPRTVSNEWRKPDVRSMLGQALPPSPSHSLSDLDWEGRSVAVPDTSREPRISPFVRDTLGVRASVLSRIYINGRSTALLAVHDCHNKRHWTPSEISFIEEVADQISLAAEEARLNKQVAEQNATIDFVFEHAPIGIIVADVTRQIRRSNEYFSVLFRMPPDEVVGKSLCNLHPDIPESQERIYDMVFAGQTILNRELRLAIPGSTTTLNEFRFSCFPIAHPTGEIHEIGILIEDITQERNAQRDMTLALARERRVNDTLQRTLLPALPPRLSTVDIGYVYRPASADRGIGGDFLDIVPLEDGRIALFIGDVTGHGVEAAAQTSLIKNMLRAYALLGDSPGTTVGRLNSALISQFQFDSLVTLFYGVLNPNTGRLDYASAGHEPPMIIRSDDRALIALEPTGTVVGLDMGVVFGDESCHMGYDDVLVLLTDGFVEARSRFQPGLLGEARLRTGLLESIADSSDLQGSADSIWEFVVDTMGTGDLEDDAALLLIARTSMAGSKGGLAYSTYHRISGIGSQLQSTGRAATRSGSR